MVLFLNTYCYKKKTVNIIEYLPSPKIPRKQIALVALLIVFISLDRERQTDGLTWQRGRETEWQSDRETERQKKEKEGYEGAKSTKT